MLIMDYDVDHDGEISSSESEALHSDIFAPLKEYGYYTYFFKGDQQLPSEKARDFSASIQGMQVVFSFTLPRPKAAETIGFYDMENMTGYKVSKAFVKEANPDHSFKVYTHDFDYYYGYILELK